MVKGSYRLSLSSSLKLLQQSCRASWGQRMNRGGMWCCHRALVLEGLHVCEFSAQMDKRTMHFLCKAPNGLETEWLRWPHLCLMNLAEFLCTWVIWGGSQV